MRFFLIFPALPFVFLLSSAHAENFTARISGVIDANTLRVNVGGGKSIKVRLYGIDCPLINQPHGIEARALQAPASAAAQYLKSFTATAQSFRALRSGERNSLEESRLRVRTARSGEKSAGVAKRTGSTWSPEALAVANGIEVDTPFRKGLPLKVAIPQAYTPR